MFFLLSLPKKSKKNAVRKRRGSTAKASTERAGPDRRAQGPCFINRVGGRNMLDIVVALHLRRLPSCGQDNRRNLIPNRLRRKIRCGPRSMCVISKRFWWYYHEGHYGVRLRKCFSFYAKNHPSRACAYKMTSATKAAPCVFGEDAIKLARSGNLSWIPRVPRLQVVPGGLGCRNADDHGGALWIFAESELQALSRTPMELPVQPLQDRELVFADIVVQDFLAHFFWISF